MTAKENTVGNAATKLRATWKTLMLIAAGLFLPLVVGCATPRVNMVESGEVAMQVIETHPITVKRVSVTRSPKGIFLHGHVARHRNRALPLRGHVDVEFISPDDQIIHETSLRFTTRRLTRRMWEGTFTARLNFDLPGGSTIRVKHHDAKHTKG